MNMNKKILAFSILAMFVLAIGGVAAYEMLSLKSHINVKESQSFEYKANDAWHAFPLNTGATLDLGTADMAAGDASTFEVRATNPNNRPIQYIVTVQKWDNLTTQFTCTQSGVKYSVTSNDNSTVVKIMNEANSTIEAGITTIIDAGAALTDGYPIQPVSTVERMEVESIEWQTCA